MTWSIEFEVSALVAQLVLMILFLSRKKLPTRQNKTFSFMVIFLFLATLFDILAAVSSDAPVQLYFKYFLNIVYSIAASTLLVIQFYYFLVLFDKVDILKRKGAKLFFLAPYLIMLLIILSNPWNKWLFYFNAQGEYIFGSLHFIAYIYYVFYIFWCCELVINNSKIHNRYERICVLISYGVVIAGIIIQLFWLPRYLLTFSMATIGLIIIYLTFQNYNKYIDSFSQLFNKEAYECMIEESAAVPYKRYNVYVMINGYDVFFNLYGSEECEKISKYVGECLKNKIVPHPKEVFRLNEKQFVCSFTNKDSIYPYEQELRKTFEAKYYTGLNFVKIELNICMEDIEKEKFDVHLNHRLTNFAFDMLEKEGNGCSLIINDNAINRLRRQFKIERAITEALQNKRVKVCYQPIYCVETGEYRCVEALVRIEDNELGLISPEEFVPIAEKNGLMVELGELVFEKVCQFLDKNRPVDIHPVDYRRRVNVNISPVQAQQDNLYERFSQIAAIYNVPMRCINLELTESLATEFSESFLKQVKNFKEQGANLSLDDYGTGYSNFAYILEVQFEHVKIDKSLIWKHFYDDSKILEYIISMFKSIGIEIVAEGVETKQMADELINLGVDYLQGYYFAKPMPEKKLLEFLKQPAKI